MKLFNFNKKKKEKLEEQILENPSELLTVKLFFKNRPVIDDNQIEKELKKRFDRIEFPDYSEGDGKSRQYFFEDYKVKYENGEIPAQGTILIPDTNDIDHSLLVPAFGQSWNWPEAEEYVKKCGHEILVTDLMSRGLDYKERIEYFQKFLESIILAMQPEAIWFRTSELILKPADFLENCGQNNYQNLSAFMNVRLFNLQETDNEMVMDTLGLHSLGLPDFEIRFSSYDPQKIAGILFNYGNYIFENGVVIEHGNTIEGVEQNQKWKCHFNESLLEPKRIVIGIDNGG